MRLGVADIDEQEHLALDDPGSASGRAVEPHALGEREHHERVEGALAARRRRARNRAPAGRIENELAREHLLVRQAQAF